MALAASTSRLRDLQRELNRPSEGEAPIQGPPPGGMGAVPDAGEYAAYGESVVPIRTPSAQRPKLDNTPLTIEGLEDRPVKRGVEAISGFAQKIWDASQGLNRPDRPNYRNAKDAEPSFTPKAEDYRDTKTQAQNTYGEEPSGAGQGFSTEQHKQGLHSGTRGQPSDRMTPEERAQAEAAFNALWESDVSQVQELDGTVLTQNGAIRSTYTTEDNKPDFESFIADQLEDGSDPGSVAERLSRTVKSRGKQRDSAGRTVAGYDTQVSPREGYTAEEQAQIDSAPKPYVPGASRLPKGVTRPKPYVHKSAGGENAQGANKISGPGMPAHAKRLTDSVDEAMKDEDGQPIEAGNGKYVKYPGAHEQAEDTRHDMEGSWSPQDVANGRFPTSLDQWAVLLQQNNNPDDERAYVLHLAQQMGFDLSGVPEENQYEAAQRMVAEQMFRYGDAAQKKWAKGWGGLTGDRWHISRHRRDKVDKDGNVIAKKGDPLATQPMRTAVWDPAKGQFVDSATGYARGRTERIQDIAATREKVKRRAILGPAYQMSAEEIAADMGQENWDSLTPMQQRAFTGEMERGARAFQNSKNSARNAQIRAGTDRARGWYNEEMEKATTPFEAFKIARKYGDERAAAYYANMVAGDQEVAAAAANRRGEPSVAEQVAGTAGVRKDATTAVAAGGSPAAAKAVMDPEGLNPKGTNREIAQGVVSSWRDSGQLEGMSPADVVNHPGLRDYLRDNVDGGAMFRGDEDWTLPSWMGGIGISGNNTLSLQFAQSVIADLGLPQTPEYVQALSDWWRSQPEVDDPADSPPQGAPAQAPPQSNPPTSTAAGYKAMWSW